MMKFKAILLYALISPQSYSQAQSVDIDMIARSLANYQACSDAAIEINDVAMHSYYQKMFNDSILSVLSIDAEEVKPLYRTWEKSERVLANIDKQSMQKLCLSRFDELSRSVINKIVAQ